MINNSGAVWVDGFTGTDDQKLQSAINYAKSQPNRPPIQLSARAYSLSPIQTYDGLKLYGSPGASNAERQGVGSTSTVIKCLGSGSWLRPVSEVSPGESWDVTIQGIAFRGNSGLSWVVGDKIVLWCWDIRDVSFHGFKSVLGTQESKLLIDACLFDGWWDIGNSYTGAIHIGGSDCFLWPDGGLVDSNVAYLAPGKSAGQFHLWVDGLYKTTIGPLYITCEGGWGGFRSTGNTVGGPVWLNNLVVEGRNAGKPGNIASVRIDGGWVVASNLWTAYITGVSPVQINGGLTTINGCSYGQANVPPQAWCSMTAGHLDVSKVYSTAGPKIKVAVKKTGGTIVSDSTVSVIQ